MKKKHKKIKWKLKLTSMLVTESSIANEVLSKWLPDKFNTFNCSNEWSKSIGIKSISAIDNVDRFSKF